MFYDEFRSDVPLKDISMNMQNAIVAAEDHQFYKHNGVDVKGVARAMVSNNSGKTQQGASTLTMQYVRMSLAYSATNPQEVVDATKDTPKRKITEMKYALQVEKELTKQQILERYLNIAPFGNGAYGIFAASQVYFSKKPKDLTIAEAALLAGMVKAPTAFDPTTDTGYPQARDRRELRPAEHGRPGLHHAGRSSPRPTRSRSRARSSGSATAASRCRRTTGASSATTSTAGGSSQETFGTTQYERERRLKSGGYRIVTSLDLKAQEAARKRVTEHISDKNKNALLLAGIQPGTGQVRTLAANRKFKLDDPTNPQNKISSDPKKAKKKIRGTYPNTTNPLLSGGGDITGYQAGSVFKMFTIVAALEKGYPLSYTIKAEKVAKTNYIVQRGSPAACPGTHFYCPRTGGSSPASTTCGPASVGRSTRSSCRWRNASAPRTWSTWPSGWASSSAPDDDADLANNKQAASQWGAFTLGVSASTPLEMANAYATLAGDGMYCEPTPVAGDQDAEGREARRRQPALQPGHLGRRGPRRAGRGPLPGRRPARRPAAAAARPPRGPPTPPSSTRSSARPAPPTRTRPPR